MNRFPTWQGMQFFEIGELTIPTYSFLIGLAVIYASVSLYFIAAKEKAPRNRLPGLIGFTIFSGLLFARLFHVIFYDWDYYQSNLWEIPQIWKGGLASHGGALGFVLGIVIHTRFWGNIWYWWLFDRIAIIIPFAAALIRLGNFANSEIYGKISNCSFCLVFQQVDPFPRYPVQLMEAGAYFLTGIILWRLYLKKWKWTNFGYYTALMLIGINLPRFFIEFLKASPEIVLGLNTGQLFSFSFVLIGFFILLAAWRKWLN